MFEYASFFLAMRSSECAQVVLGRCGPLFLEGILGLFALWARVYWRLNSFLQAARTNLLSGSSGSFFSQRPHPAIPSWVRQPLTRTAPWLNRQALFIDAIRSPHSRAPNQCNVQLSGCAQARRGWIYALLRTTWRG